MAEQDDKDSKTEDATEKKVRDAVGEGNVPSSREVATLASLLAIMLAGIFFISGGVIRLQNALIRFIDNPGGWRLESGSDAVVLLHGLAADAARLVIPMVLTLLVAGVGAALIQNPPQFVAKRLKPQLSRISLKKGWERLFSMKGVVEFGKAVFKLSAAVAVALLVVQASEFEVLASIFMEPILLPGLLLDIIMRMVGWVAVLTLALVIADVLWSRFSWRRDLRMTKQEIKDEHKQTEGDPHIKARIKALARERARRRMIAAVPRATVIITNPTHYAVALRYVRSEGGAPVVLAKGLDLIALKIREVAEQHDIPIIEDKPLARSLYEAVEVDRLIPPQFYKAVAEIIFYLNAQRSPNQSSRLKS